VIRVSDLETMDRAALVAAWSDIFKAPPPKSLSRAFLRRFLAAEVQTRRLGGMSKSTLKALDRRADETLQTTTPQLAPGGRLIREWNGVTHIVEVAADGYRWRDTTWRSLSAIAREITGAHWSGPRFFGLTGKGRS